MATQVLIRPMQNYYSLVFTTEREVGEKFKFAPLSGKYMRWENFPAFRSHFVWPRPQLILKLTHN